MSRKRTYDERLRAMHPAICAEANFRLVNQAVLLIVVCIALFGVGFLVAGLAPLFDARGNARPDWLLLAFALPWFIFCGGIWWMFFGVKNGLRLEHRGILATCPLTPVRLVPWADIQEVGLRQRHHRGMIAHVLVLRVGGAGTAGGGKHSETPGENHSVEVLCDSWVAPNDMVQLVRAWCAHHRAAGRPPHSLQPS